MFPFEICLPVEVAGNQQIVFDANSRWCQRDTTLGLYAAGFWIQHIADKDRKLIAQTIAAFGLRP